MNNKKTLVRFGGAITLELSVLAASLGFQSLLGEHTFVALVVLSFLAFAFTVFFLVWMGEAPFIWRRLIPIRSAAVRIYNESTSAGRREWRNTTFDSPIKNIELRLINQSKERGWQLWGRAAQPLKLEEIPLTDMNSLRLKEGALFEMSRVRTH